MFSDFLLTWREANLLGLVVLIVAALWLRYIAKRASFVAHGPSDKAGAVPSTFPYAVPLLGTLPISYLWNPKGFVLGRDNFFQSAHPTRVRVLTHEFYAVRGPADIKALFKASAGCTSIPFVKFALGHAFGLPAAALRLFDRDDSGGAPRPHPDSTVEPRNRVDYRGHHSVAQLLEGGGLAPLWARFAAGVTAQMHALRDGLLGSGGGWEHRGDLMRLVGDEMTVPILNALCGPDLLRLNPGFVRAYWEFDRHLQTYLQGIPWFLALKAYAARNRVLNAIKVWQQHARDHFHDSAIGPDGDDPFWGSSFFRKRQDLFLEMDGFDYDAIASSDLGAIWAARNAIVATSWIMFELYRDPALLATVRAEVDSCAVKGGDGSVHFDVDSLLCLPMLQAVYAETLRLRMHFYIIKMPDRVDIKIRDWVIPRRKVIVTATTVAHMDTEAWSTGVNHEHPVDQFWAGRFLRWRSASGGKEDAGSSSPALEFSTKGLEGSWIPYGGGPRKCPGRHFAKRQILLSTALMVSLFDCEIMEEGRNVQEDLSLWGFGGGISKPVGRVPVKIRRRVTVPDSL